MGAHSAPMHAKIATIDRVREETARWRARGLKVGFTNGCFDILHAGHVTYLAAARALGDALLVGLNSDASVRVLKGAGRPVNSEPDRATVLAALAAVDGVCLFEEVDALRLLAEVKPDIYAKGGDYTLDTINQPERRLIESAGGKVVILPGVPGRSTSNVLAKIAKS